MALTFTEGTIPQLDRARKENTFQTALTDNKVDFPFPEGKSMTVKLPYKTDDEKAAANTFKTDGQRFGRENNVTLRVKTNSMSDDGIVYVMWCVPAIKRTPKSKDEAQAEPAATKSVPTIS